MKRFDLEDFGPHGKHRNMVEREGGFWVKSEDVNKLVIKLTQRSTWNDPSIEPIDREECFIMLSDGEIKPAITDLKLKKWFDAWFKKKTESDYLFPIAARGFLWLAFLAGAHTDELLNNMGGFLVPNVVMADKAGLLAMVYRRLGRLLRNKRLYEKGMYECGIKAAIMKILEKKYYGKIKSFIPNESA